MKKQKRKKHKKYIPKQNPCICMKTRVLDFIQKLSVLELSVLVKEFENKFGVSSLNPDEITVSNFCEIGVKKKKFIELAPFHIMRNEQFNLKSRRS